MTKEPTSSEATLSAYAEIDAVIERWVERDRLTLCREWQGEARFWYTSRGGECFQISVDRPVKGWVTVHARSVDTDDDAELQGEWSIRSDALERALVAANRLIDLWADRSRTSD